MLLYLIGLEEEGALREGTWSVKVAVNTTVRQPPNSTHLLVMGRNSQVNKSASERLIYVLRRGEALKSAVTVGPMEV